MKILGIDSTSGEEATPHPYSHRGAPGLLAAALDGLRSRYRDADVELIELSKFRIGRGDAGSPLYDPLLSSVAGDAQDDMLVLYPKLLGAEAVVFSIASCWGHLPSDLMIFLERLRVLDGRGGRRTLGGKVAGAISSTGPDGTSRAVRDVLSIANALGFVIPPHTCAACPPAPMPRRLRQEEGRAWAVLAEWNANVVVDNVYMMARLIQERGGWAAFQESRFPGEEEIDLGSWRFRSLMGSNDEHRTVGAGDVGRSASPAWKVLPTRGPKE